MNLKKIFNEPIYILLIVLVIIFFPCLFDGKTLFYRDLSVQDYPFIKYSVDLIWSGEFPFWNDRVLSGSPQFASIQPPILYPGFIFYLLLPFHTALSLLLIIHYFLGGLGVYLIGKRFNLSKESSLLGAIVYSLNGYMFEMNNLQYLVYASTWIPYCFLFFNDLIEKKDRKSLIKLVLSYTLIILTGRLDYFYFLVIFISIWFLIYLFFIKKSNSFDLVINKNTFILISISFLFPILVSLAQIIPSIEYIRNSYRGDSLSFKGATFWSMNPYQLFQLIFNNLFGNIFIYKGIFHYIDTKFLVYNLYVGFNILVFSILGISRENKKSLTLIILFILFTLLSFGSYTPLYSFLFEYLPGFSFLRYPIKLFIFSLFSLSLLVMFGFEKILENTKKILSIYSIYLSTCLFLVVGIKIFENDLVNYFNNIISKSGVKISDLDFMVFSILFSFVIGILFILALFFYKREKINIKVFKYLIVFISLYELTNYNLSNLWVIDKNVLYDKSPLASSLEELLNQDLDKYYILTDVEGRIIYDGDKLIKIVDDFVFESKNINANFSLNSKLYNAFGYSPSPPLNLFKIYTWINDEIDTVKITDQQKIKILKFMGVKYYIWHVNNIKISKPNTKYMKFVKSFPEQQVDIFEIPKPDSKISFKYRTFYLKDEIDIAKTIVGFKNKEFNFDTDILINDHINSSFLNKNIKNNNFRYDVISKTNDSIHLKVSSENPGFIKVAENYSSNWKLHINGVEKEILKANYYQMAFEIPKGNIDVYLKHDNSRIKYSFIASFISVLFVTIFLFKKNLKIYV